MEKKNKLKLITKTNETLANAIRRSINQIPILAIEDVEIHKNDSALYDEVLAQRLGLIPLKDKRKINEREKCTCKGKGCNKCILQFTLKASGPNTIYSDNIKGDVEIIYDKMPIVILDKNQEIEIICFAQLGKGTSHAKYSPGLSYYRNIAEIKIKNVEKANLIIGKLKDSLINFKGTIKNGDIIKSDADIDYIESLTEESDIIEITPSEELVYFIESWGQIEPKDILKGGVKELNNNLKEVLKAVK